MNKETLQIIFDARKKGGVSIIEKMNPYLPDEIFDYFESFSGYNTLEEALKDKPESLEILL